MKRRLFVVPFVAASLLAVLPVTVTLAQLGDTGSLTEPSPPVPDQQPEALPPGFPPVKSIPECKPGQTAKDGCVESRGPFFRNMKDFAGKKYKPNPNPIIMPFNGHLGTPSDPIPMPGPSALEEYYMKHPELLKNGPNASSETMPPEDVRRRLYAPPRQPRRSSRIRLPAALTIRPRLTATRSARRRVPLIWRPRFRITTPPSRTAKTI